MEMQKQRIKDQEFDVHLQEPKDYKVILINDDITPMDFVVVLIMDVFNKNKQEAEQLMMTVHTKGEATVGVYVYDIAASKCIKVLNLAQINNFPLQCRIEAVD